MARWRVERVSAATAGFGLAAAASTALDWARSGQRWRSSYELVDVAGRAGVLREDLAGVTWIWFLVPALAGAVLLATALRRHVLAGGCATTLGGLVGTGSFLVGRSPLPLGAAAPAALVLGLATALGGVAILVTARTTEAA